jgi:ATP diphosphatase
MNQSSNSNRKAKPTTKKTTSGQDCSAVSLSAWEELLRVVAKLRDPQGGCPWDLEQTHDSLTPYVIEEAYEVVEAIRFDRAKLCEELGDVLLQVVLHSQLASEAGTFTATDVVETLTKKLIHRHPHVFGDVKAASTDEVLRNWEKLKRQEGYTGETPRSAIAGVPRSLPALQRSHRLGEKASRVGFDWPSPEAVLEKVREEFDEVTGALRDSGGEDSPAVKEEIGDLLFALAQWARKMGSSAEELLQHANEKFVRRFSALERNAPAGSSLDGLSLEQLEGLWQKAKAEVG